jgi:hypothetical protein
MLGRGQLASSLKAKEAEVVAAAVCTVAYLIEALLR